MATANEKWTPRRFRKNTDGTLTAEREFQIIGASSDAEAFAADLVYTDLGTTTGKVPVKNEAHPSNPFMKAGDLELSFEGYNLYNLAVSYSIPTGGGSHDDDTDLLNKPLRIQWDRRIQVEQFDRDADGNPIVGSARDPFTQAQDRDITNRIVRFRRYEPFYDLAKAEIYENTVNLQSWEITGLFVVPPGKAKLNTYQPTGEYTLEDENIEVEYEIELRPDGFRSRHRDEGPRANSAAGPVKCYTLANEELDRVLLNGKGVPLEATIRLGTNSLVRAELPSPTGAIVETTADAVFLLYKRYPELNFNGLGLT